MSMRSKAITSFFACLPGVLLSFTIAIPAWLIGKKIPIVGGPVIAILSGILITTLFPNLTAKQCGCNITLGDGVKCTSKKLLQYSIVLLGFEMNLQNVLRVGMQSLFVMLFTLSAAFLTAFLMGRLLHISPATTTLIGVGTAICGGSAIAAVAPAIHADDEDISQAISTIFLFNIFAVFLFPAIGHVMGMSDISFGMWAGTAINDTSSVVAAGTVWSSASSNDTALQFATIVKLTRTLMIVPVTLVLAFYNSRKQKRTGDRLFRLTKVFPWFVVFFLFASLAKTFTGIPVVLSKQLVTLGKFVIVMAMVAIGLNTNLKKLLSNGIKPIILGLCCWFAVAIVSLLVQHLIGT